MQHKWLRRQRYAQTSVVSQSFRSMHASAQRLACTSAYGVRMYSAKLCDMTKTGKNNSRYRAMVAR